MLASISCKPVQIIIQRQQTWKLLNDEKNLFPIRKWSVEKEYWHHWQRYSRAAPGICPKERI
ncbi:hypothetical protein ABE28_013540 [Peribacillus muralis]|uniref:Uncharacterized protein n=1 Tax=Peribacillus muralis TaxID=264697 RepID=A0A1B3XQ84_9BACI|nr:hypothetical protein [Peribacillus muralis]AOH55376.1 hypothetical protein ABE28_013540 [Peribacillus muralis]